MLMFFQGVHEIAIAKFWFFFIKEKELGPCGDEQTNVDMTTAERTYP
jgi:hypothetical protein